MKLKTIYNIRNCHNFVNVLFSDTDCVYSILFNLLKIGIVFVVLVNSPITSLKPENKSRAATLVQAFIVE